MATPQKTSTPKTNTPPPAPAPVAAAPGNSGVIFKKLGKDFVMPPRAVGGEWDATLQNVLANKGEAVALFESAEEQQAYSRVKSLKGAILRAKLAKGAVEYGVRKMGDLYTLIAKAV